jgi:hypothetical protein
VEVFFRQLTVKNKRFLFSFFLSVFLSFFLSFILSLWLFGRFFSFLILYTVGRTPWTGDQPVSRPLPTHRTTQTQNKRTQTSMHCVGFEPTILVFEREKTVHALECAVTVIGRANFPSRIFPTASPKICVKTVFPRCREVPQVAKIMEFLYCSKRSETTNVHRLSDEVPYVDRNLWPANLGK